MTHDKALEAAVAKEIILAVQLRDFGHIDENGDFRCSAAQIDLLERQAKIAASAAITAITAYLASFTGEHGDLVKRLNAVANDYLNAADEEADIEGVGTEDEIGMREHAGLLREAGTALTAQSALLAQREADNERLRRLIESASAIFQNCTVTDGMCCCGDDMERHPSPMNCGHSPVDSGGYAADNWLKEVATLSTKETNND